MVRASVSGFMGAASVKMVYRESMKQLSRTSLDSVDSRTSIAAPMKRETQVKQL